MNLYEVSYHTWNNSFSDLNAHSELSVGISEEDAITKLKALKVKDCRDFTARKIEKVMGYEILVKQ